MDYQSCESLESVALPGVRFCVRSMSFGRRLDLMKRVGDTLARLEFIQAGVKSPERDAEATTLGAEVDREFLLWGLASIEGLEIDGEAATPSSLIESGPEVLMHEALRAVRATAGLTDEERKNSESPFTLPTVAKPSGSATTAAA